MARSTTRFFAVLILVLLGVPVALHVVLHDLRDHHDQLTHVDLDAAEHSNHEHPVIASGTPDADSPVSSVETAVAAAVPATRTLTVCRGRNAFSHGAVRLDDDVGLQPLLSTFLI